MFKSLMWLVDFITEQQKEEKRKKEKEEPSHYYRKWSWTLLLQQLSAPQPLSYWWRIIRYHQRKMAPKAGPTGCSSVTSVPCPFASFLVPSHRFFFLSKLCRSQKENWSETSQVTFSSTSFLNRFIHKPPFALIHRLLHCLVGSTSNVPQI